MEPLITDSIAFRDVLLGDAVILDVLIGVAIGIFFAIIYYKVWK